MTQSQIALTLAKVAKALLNSDMVEDEEHLNSAISSVAKKYFDTSLTPKKKSTESSRLARISEIIENSNKNKEKLKNIRKKLDDEQTSSLQKTPNINLNSKKICKKLNRDIIERSDIDLENRNKKMNQKKEMKIKRENEEFRKNCSFSPFGRIESTRNPDEIVKDLYDWKSRTSQKLAQKVKEKQNEEMKEVYAKPIISKNLKSRRWNREKSWVSGVEQNASFCEGQDRKMSSSPLASKSCNKLQVRKEVSGFKQDRPLRDFSSRYTYEEIVRMLSCNSSFG